MRLLQTWRYNILTALVLALVLEVYYTSMLQHNYRKISKMYYVSINNLIK